MVGEVKHIKLWYALLCFEVSVSFSMSRNIDPVSVLPSGQVLKSRCFSAVESVMQLVCRIGRLKFLVGVFLRQVKE